MYVWVCARMCVCKCVHVRMHVFMWYNTRPLVSLVQVCLLTSAVGLGLV